MANFTTRAASITPQTTMSRTSARRRLVAPLAQPLVTAIEIGTSEPEPAAHEVSSMIVDEAAAEVAPPAAEFGSHAGDDAASSAAEPVPSRRPRGEPVSSEPRIARITVKPDGPPLADIPAKDEAAGESGEADDKPTRRGWWQRKLLGDV